MLVGSIFGGGLCVVVVSVESLLAVFESICGLVMLPSFVTAAPAVEVSCAWTVTNPLAP